MVSGLSATANGGHVNGMTLGFDTLPGLTYALEWKSNLLSASWQPLTNFTANGATVQVELTKGSPRGFCRIRLEP